MRRRLVLPLLGAAAVAACSGWNDGGNEPVDERPVPVIAAIAPPLASVNSIVRISGEKLSGARVRVLFGDVEGEVLSAVDTEIRARGAVGSTSTDVVVEVNGVRSNAVALALAPSGTTRPIAEGGPSQPRGITLDAGGGLLWIFDIERGVYVFALANGAYRLHRPRDGGLSQAVAGAALSETELLIADAATHSIVSMDVDSAAVTPLVTGLPLPPFALALDSAGNLYWAYGTGDVGRRSAAGVVDPAFATVPHAGGIAVAGGALWASDSVAGSIHRVDLGTLAVTSGFVAGLAGVRGLSRDGTGVVACFDGGAVRVDAAGAVTPATPVHPIAADVHSIACENGSGTIFTLREGVTSSKNGEPWLLRVPLLQHDAADAVWLDDRLYIVADKRCASGGTGAIVEAVAPGSFRSKASGVCARDTISPRATGGISWVDRVDGIARRLDLATGTVVVAGSNAAFAAALGSASNADAELFVSTSAGALARYAPDAAFLEAIASSGTHPVFSDTLYFVSGGQILSALFNHGEYLGTTIAGDATGVIDLAPVLAGGALAGDGMTVRRITPGGGVTPLGGMGPGERIGLTPFGELHRTADGHEPIAVLP